MHQSKKCTDTKAFGHSGVVKRHLTAGPKGDLFGNGRPQRRAGAVHLCTNALPTSKPRLGLGNPQRVLAQGWIWEEFSGCAGAGL